MLDHLAVVAEPEWHAEKFLKAEQSGDGRLWHVAGMDGNLVVSAYEVNFSEYVGFGQTGGEVLQMGNMLPVWYG